MATCSSCGFLTVRGVGGGFIEVDDLYRRQAKRDPASTAHADVEEWRRLPLCFMLKYNLPGEIHDDVGSTNDQPAVLKTITAERDCDGWTEWQQGFTPKEHREDEIRQAIWDREDRRDAIVEQQHQDEMNTLRVQHRWQLAIFGGAVILATLLGSMIQAGWIDKPW